MLLRLQSSGSQALLLLRRGSTSGGEQSSGDGILGIAGLRRWRGKMEWRRREDGLQMAERRALSGNGVGSSDGGQEEPRSSSSGSGASPSSSSSSPPSSSSPSSSLSSSQDGSNSRVEDTDAFCIIEGREAVLDFSQMQLKEIRNNITSRRNKIFLLMEEVRRLRVQQRIKSAEQGVDAKDSSADNEMPKYPSSIPFLPPLTTATLKQYYAAYFAMVSIVILFGGLVAPALELKLGMGGTSYEDFIRNMHLPLQLSEVDPIVASFSGGAVGVISSLMVVEINNVKQQEHKRCRYCHGTGYLACARCSGSGSLVVAEPVASVGLDDRPLAAPTTQRCPNCSGATKVMCPSCLCTGMALASEHDPRIDPFV